MGQFFLEEVSARETHYRPICLLCVEGLSLSLKAASENGSIIGFRICPQTPAITHLLFTDDSFCASKLLRERRTRLNKYSIRMRCFQGKL